MTVDINVYEWKGNTWHGWWKGDGGAPTTYKNVELRSMDSGNLRHGVAVGFEQKNGDDWSPEEPGIDRHIMEAAQVNFYIKDYVLEGFVQVQHFGALHADNDDPVFRKQRWVVTLKNPI